jgi:hypothetical protein
LQAPPDAPCPACGAKMSPQAILCMSCGYNRKTGSTVAAAPLPPRSAVPGSAAKSWVKWAPWLAIAAVFFCLAILIFFVNPMLAFSLGLPICGLMFLAGLAMLLVGLAWSLTILTRNNPEMAKHVIVNTLFATLTGALTGYAVYSRGGVNFRGRDEPLDYTRARRCLKYGMLAILGGLLLGLVCVLSYKHYVRQVDPPFPRPNNPRFHPNGPMNPGQR